MTGVNLLEIFIANGMGLMLMYGVLVGNAFEMQKKVESRMLYFMAIILIVCCAIDPIVFYYDGKEGAWIPFVLYLGNFLLYLSNLLFGPTFLFLVERHTFGKNSKLLRRIIIVIDVVLAVVLIMNFFQPNVFYIDEANCYQRLPLFFLYTAAGMSFTVMALVIYLISRIRGGFYKSFPVFELVAPIFLGLLVQSTFYGVSLIWPATAVGLTLMVLSIQNRNIVLDPLTGLYNRKYLDSFKFRDKNYCLMMLDLNGFKAINDTYGHSEGDVALQKTAELLLTTIGHKGTAVRYAGDEFILLLNTDKEEVILDFICRLRNNFKDYYSNSEKPYNLSFSLGWGVFNFKLTSRDEIFKTLDEKMYEDKKEYYRVNDRRKR